jgi:anaerobic selenocysteine-containing dehydrogenase/Fe-S-cluster-containing dehydrogenase component
MDRKTFLQILGLSGAGVVSGCKTDSQRLLIPYLVPPKDIIPGIANWYASTCRECPAGCGILVRCREGRAVKVEGNSAHPINKGKLCARGQAILQELYNPDRLIEAQVSVGDGKFKSLPTDEAQKQISEKLKKLIADGKGIRIAMLTPLMSGSLAHLSEEFMKSLGAEKPLVYEAVHYSSVKEACEKLFGQAIVPKISLSGADVIVSIGADFMETYISPVEYTRQFYEESDEIKGRKNVLIYAGPQLTLTANAADSWLALPAGSEKLFALSLLNEICTISSGDIRVAREYCRDYPVEIIAPKINLPVEEVKHVAKLLLKAKQPVIMGGISCDVETQIAIMLINHLISAIGKNVFIDTPLSVSEVSSPKGVEEFVANCNANKYEALIILNTNPAYSLPGGIKFNEAVHNIPLVISFTPMMNETSELAHYIIPTNTPLEDWDDYSPSSNITNFQQPVMESVFGVLSTGDYLLNLAKMVTGNLPQDAVNYYNYILNHNKLNDDDWKKTLGIGFIEKPQQQSSHRFSLVDLEKPTIRELSRDKVRLFSIPSYKYYDGRGANKPWLSEVPHTMTSVVWGNYLVLNSKYAEKAGIKNNDIVEINADNGKIEIPVKVTSDIEYHSASIEFGLGHSKYGRYGNALGVDTSKIFNQELWESVEVKIRNTGKWEKLVAPNDTDLQYQRKISRAVLVSEAGTRIPVGEDINIYPKVEHETYRWGMTIDLDKCTGCGACVVACFAENNIPFVGKELIAKGREMQWLRIERYREEEFVDYGNRFIPMMCQQCENAPCEPVCPVYAAYHSKDGLNVQVYNRCIGTRYCSNNCPYKVRRFNWFSYEHPHPTNLQLNPDVTVRDKGVMEKCTFCVQRIVEARGYAKDENRLIRDGEIKPACAQTCPTNAIIFGNLLDEDSVVSKLSKNPRAYRPIEEYNTRSAITYLQKVVKDEFVKLKKKV